MRTKLIIAAAIIFYSCNTQPQNAANDNENGAFSFNAANIAKVEVQNYEDSRCSYILTNDSTNLTLVCKKHGTINADRGQVQQYLSYFYYIEYESDSLCADSKPKYSIAQHPAYEIDLTLFDNKHHKMLIYHKKCEDCVNLFGEKIKYDKDRCYVQCDTSSLYCGLWLNYDILTPDCQYFKRKD